MAKLRFGDDRIGRVPTGRTRPSPARSTTSSARAPLFWPPGPTPLRLYRINLYKIKPTACSLREQRLSSTSTWEAAGLGCGHACVGDRCVRLHRYRCRQSVGPGWARGSGANPPATGSPGASVVGQASHSCGCLRCASYPGGRVQHRRGLSSGVLPASRALVIETDSEYVINIFTK